MKTRCSRISPVSVLTKRTVIERGAWYVRSFSRHSWIENCGLAKTLFHEPLEGRLLDVDEVGEVEDVLQARKALARARRDSNAAQV